MSYKVKLTVAIALAALAFPTLASAQDPTTRTDIVVIGATLSGAEESEEASEPAPVLPVVYEDAAEDKALTGDAAPDLNHAVEAQQAR